VAVDFSENRHLVFFELDKKSPHDLSRFHRNISQMTANGTLSVDDFEEVIGSYRGALNVAYVMPLGAFVAAFSRIEIYLRGQLEIYICDLDDIEASEVWNFQDEAWQKKPLGWAIGYSAGHAQPDAEGWTYIPSSGMYLTLISGEDR
jgi:hypothetical protein